ncbi:MAG: hypothetical protein GX055_05520 [Desulfovibrionales bacterium]|nr:hypothetical protein [Desulfovibrionales bacterium]
MIQSPNRSPRQMSGQLAVMAVLVAVLPVICLLAVIFVFFDAAHKEKNFAALSEGVWRNAQNADTFIQERLANLIHENQGTAVDALAKPEYLRVCLHRLQASYQGFFTDLELLDASGQIVAHAGPTPVDTDGVGEAWLPSALSRPTYVRGFASEGPFFVGVRLTDQGQTWFLRAFLDRQPVEERLNALHPGGSGDVLVLNKNAPSTLPRVTEKTVQLLAKQTFADGQPVVFEAPDTAGVPQIYVSAPLRSSGETVVYCQAKAEILRPLTQVRIFVGLVTVLGIGAIVATVMAMSRRMEQRLLKAEVMQQQMQNQLVEAGKLAAIGELAAGIAHEINNPLAIMIENAGWIQDLLADEEQSEEDMVEIQSSLQAIVLQGHRCREIIQKLLGFARKTDSSARLTQVNALLDDIVNFTRQKAKYAGVTIHTSLAAQLPDIEASPTEVQQVIFNLVNNALDSVPQDTGVVRIRSLREGDMVGIDVEDNGSGISEEHQKHIFEPFFTTKPKGKGTGLGLSICHNIVSQMGGSISLESQPGLGSTFRIRLPIQS